jgi:AraC-like DNA-binding protein
MIISEFIANKRDGIDLSVYHCGMEICKNDHYFGPAVRNHYLIHYILDGEGTFQVGGKVFYLKKNQGFLICPEVVTFYKANSKNPWKYAWVGFNGIKAEQYLKSANLSSNNPIFTYSEGDYIEKCFEQMLQSAHLKFSSETRLQGFLYLFLSELIEKNACENLTRENQRDLYIKKAIQFIEANYSRDISINQIASYLGINRSYFSTLFKAVLKVSPQEFLIKFRMDKAASLISSSSLSISEVSRSVGYDDPLAFSKIFKKLKSCAPREYKNNELI